MIATFLHFQKQATNKPTKTNSVSLAGTEMTDPKDGGTASKAGGGGSPGDFFLVETFYLRRLGFTFSFANKERSNKLPQLVKWWENKFSKGQMLVCSLLGPLFKALAVALTAKILSGNQKYFLACQNLRETHNVCIFKD